MSANAASSRWELKLVGRTLNVMAMVFLSAGIALGASLYEDIPAFERTLGGLGLALVAGILGEIFSRRENANTWFSTTLTASGYSLAYFFMYATYYVPGLHSFDTPYACWALGLGLAGVAAWHGMVNESVRRFTSVFTLLATAQALYHALSSTAVVSLFDHEVRVAAVACLVGVVWCGGLSALYKRLELRYPKWADCKEYEDAANWLLYRVSHELYFVLAAGCAMALPLFLNSLADAPIWWSLQAPVLLALTWRSGNFFKHGVVGLMWAVAAWAVASAPGHAISLPSFISVIGSGVAMSMAYRYLTSSFAQHLKVAGHCFYLYAAVAVAVLVPYVQFGYWDAMPYWMIEGLLLCLAGLALRDGIVHDAGVLVSGVALALFGMHFNTWSWELVGPVVALAYSLSVAYSYVHRKGGWDKDPFLPFGSDKAISVARAELLEKVWSWAGFAIIVAASFFLVNHAQTVMWWSAEALVLVCLGFGADRIGYRLQALAAFGLASAKLVVMDLSGFTFGWHPELVLVFARAIDLAVLGSTMLVASILYFRAERKAEIAANPPASTDAPNAPEQNAQDEGAHALKGDDEENGKGGE